MTPPALSYYIRPFQSLREEHIQPPRYIETVRRSLDGELCVVAFVPGTEPEGWPAPMTREEVTNLLEGPDAAGVWYEEEGLQD